MTYLGEETLVKKEKSIYHFIGSFIEENHYSPAIMDIAKGVGVSPGTVPLYLQKLKVKGLISFVESSSRSIVLTKYDYRLVEKVG